MASTRSSWPCLSRGEVNILWNSPHLSLSERTAASSSIKFDNSVQLNVLLNGALYLLRKADALVWFQKENLYSKGVFWSIRRSVTKKIGCSASRMMDVVSGQGASDSVLDVTDISKNKQLLCCFRTKDWDWKILRIQKQRSKSMSGTSETFDSVLFVPSITLHEGKNRTDHATGKVKNLVIWERSTIRTSRWDMCFTFSSGTKCGKTFTKHSHGAPICVLQALLR